jgi:hypothetical protein
MGICDGSTGASLKVEYSDNPTLAWDSASHTWTDVRAVTGMLDVTGGDKSAEGKQTFNGLIAGLSEAGLINIVLNVVFQNSETSFLEFLTDTWDGTDSTCFWLRWSYNEGATDALRRTAKIALLTNPFTGGDASSGAPVSKDLTFVVDSGIYRDTVPAP